MSLQDTIQGVIQRETPMVGVEESMEKALQIMADNDNYALLAATNGEVMGIINDTDILHCLASGLEVKQAKVGDMMTECQLITPRGVPRPCVQIDENEQVGMAIKIMDEAGVHHLLVSGAGGKVVGLVSAADLLRKVLD